jgi:hypothetical protein
MIVGVDEAVEAAMDVWHMMKIRARQTTIYCWHY